MKNAKFIKNELYKTLYRASDDTYKWAIISFTTVRYEDKGREEFVTFNNIEETDKKELWKEKLSKKISNYEDFINNNEVWKNEGTYVEVKDKVKYMEPESLSENEFALDSIEQVDITKVPVGEVNIAFIDIYDQNGTKYIMTCDFNNKDDILSKLIVNYEKLCKKGKVVVINKEEESKNDCSPKASTITFVVYDGKVKTYIMCTDKNGKAYLENTTLEKGLNKRDSNDNIKVEYKAIIEGKYTDITKEEFDAIISILPEQKDEPRNHIRHINKIDTDNSYYHHTNYGNYYVVEDDGKNKKIAIFAAAVAILGIGACYIFRNKDNVDYKGEIKKSNSYSNDNSNNSATTPVTQEENLVTTIDSYINNNTSTSTNATTTTVSDTTTVTTSLVNNNSDINNVNGNDTTVTNTTTNNNIVTTNNGYVTTTKPVSVYTGTYRTISPADTVVSSNTTKKVTKSTTQNVVSYGTVNKGDMVTAGSNAKEQVFTNDGKTTTTKKTTTTSYNKYADLIVTGEINNSSKSLVLKK